jgi:dihydrofolate synthase/folylpolyglutamate synthase
MQFNNLSEWIKYVESVHTAEIELGLDRVGTVAERLNLLQLDCPVIIIGGTNGKGSCVAGLEAIYMAAGYKVAAFTSPYLIRLNEEVRINREEATDQDLCAAFEKIEAVRGDVALTVFEYKTLAALSIFKQSQPDVILLEVGLGGRLDAVNILNADVAIVSSVAIDHADRLGATRELISREKAGIFRAGKPAVCGDYFPPRPLLQYAHSENVPLFCQGEDFSFHHEEEESDWGWQSKKTRYMNLPLPKLLLQNMSTVLMAIELLQEKLPVARAAIDTAFATVTLPGRMEVLPGNVTRIFDVSHNPAAAELLAEKLKSLPCAGKTHVVFSMLADKDIVGTVRMIKESVDEWYIAALPVKRGTPVDILEEALAKADVKNIKSYRDVSHAYHAAMDEAKIGDRIVVFGSFYTVAAVMANVKE